VSSLGFPKPKLNLGLDDVVSLSISAVNSDLLLEQCVVMSFEFGSPSSGCHRGSHCCF